MTNKISSADLRKQAEFRRQILLFLRASETHCKELGLGEKQYQCLLAIRAWPKETPPNITQVAEALLIEQHTAVELVDRAARNGLIERQRDDADRRHVYLRLTEHAEHVLQIVAQKNRVHLAQHLPGFMDFLDSMP